MASTFLVRRGSDEFLLCRRAHDAGARAIRFRDTSALTFLRSCITTDRKSTRLNSSHSQISYAVFCLKKKKTSVALPDGVTNPSHTVTVYHRAIALPGGILVRRCDRAHAEHRFPPPLIPALRHTLADS